MSSKQIDAVSNRFIAWIGSTHSVIIHTILFGGIFVLYFFGVKTEEILLILTTLVSLEAIYLSIFIQMSINRNSANLEKVEKDIDEIQEDVEDISKDVDEIQEDVEDISKDIDEIQEDDEEEETSSALSAETIEKLQSQMRDIYNELQSLKGTKKS